MPRRTEVEYIVKTAPVQFGREIRCGGCGKWLATRQPLPRLAGGRAGDDVFDAGGPNWRHLGGVLTELLIAKGGTELVVPATPLAADIVVGNLPTTPPHTTDDRSGRASGGLTEGGGLSWRRRRTGDTQ